MNMILQGKAVETPSQTCDTAGSKSHVRPVQIDPLPSWLPRTVQHYINHIESGISLRELARRGGCNPSTILRQVRRLENRRDDPLMDEGLTSHRVDFTNPIENKRIEEVTPMSAPIRIAALRLEEESVMREGFRILRRLIEPDTVLAIAADMDKAVVLRELPDGRVIKSAVVERPLAQAFALKDWIVPKKAGRITSYEISATGRAALKKMLQFEKSKGMDEAPANFDFGQADASVGTRRRMRYTASESPVAVLARRRDKDGKVFLETKLLAAAERLREDFELAQMGPRTTQNWETFLSGRVDRSSPNNEDLRTGGAAAARDRVALALRDLGPGLGEVALRVCCYLEGIETAEQRMGWAARSGKIVLRIALQRLERHYSETYGRGGPLIG